MDFLNKAYTQTLDLFRSMTPAGRLTAGLLAAAIVVGLAFLFRFQAESTDSYLLGGRPFLAGELTAVQRALSEAGLKNWELEGNRIKIPSGQKDVYIAALAENNALPADWNAPMDSAVQGQNPFRSRHEIDLSLRQAKQKELSLVIARFQNIEQASVMFDETEKDGFKRSKLKTASVAVQTNGSGLEESQIRAIRNLLATSYAGLDRANVNITDATTGMSYAPPGEQNEGGDSLYAAAKTRFETDWKKKIGETLAMIGGVVVGVNVEMHPDVRTDTETVKIDPKPVPLKLRETSREVSTTSPSTQGRPGAVSNGVGPGNQPAEISSNEGHKSTQTEQNTEQTTIPGFEKKRVITPGLTPEKVTASIGVPASYFLKVWQQSNPAKAGEAAKEPDAAELKKVEVEVKKWIEDAVVNLLPPPPPGKTPYPLVMVTSYTDLPGPAPTAISLVAQSTDWLSGNWRTLAMIGMCFVGLLMLRSLLRSTPSPERSAPEAESPSAHDHHEEESSGSDAAPSPEPILAMRRKLSSKGPNLREELRQLVKEDPDAAANVLRGWIGDAA